MQSQTLIVILIICAVLLITYLCSQKEAEQFDQVVAGKYVVPAQNDYSPIQTAISPNYVYFPEDDTYLLPCKDLDFNNPLHRWMYYYFPEFYRNCYANVWPLSHLSMLTLLTRIIIVILESSVR